MNIDSSYVNAYDISGIQQNSIEKLGNALAINKASDDPAGLSIGTELGVERSSISQSIDNINSGIALSNIAQSGLSEQKELLTNIKEQTLKASNGTLNDEDRGIIAEQINKYIEQYENIANSTNDIKKFIDIIEQNKKYNFKTFQKYTFSYFQNFEYSKFKKMMFS